MDLARDGASSVRRKYLVGHSNQHATSILDYIHLSSKLLRNVRHGQPLEIAIDPQTKNRRSSLRNQQSDESRSVSVSRPSLFVSSRSARGVGSSSTSKSAPLPGESPQKRPSSASFLRYGRTVRLVADDGGLLLVDTDGSMKKAPPTLDTDPRTLLTVFPSDPLAVGAASKCVRAGESVFLAQGVASVYAAHNVVHADTRGMRDQLNLHGGGDESPCKLVAQEEGGQRHPSRRETAVWSFSKPVESSPLTPGRSLLRSLDEEYFPHGSAVEIRQGGRVVCYEPREPVSAREPPVAVASASAPTSDNHDGAPLSRLSSNEGDLSVFPAVSMADLWLAETRLNGAGSTRGDHTTTISTRWRLVDVADEKKQQQRQRLLATCKPRLDRKLGTPNARHVNAAATAHSAASAKRPEAGSVSKPRALETRQAEILELEERLNRAARIIVRFLRRICIDEAAKKRISNLAQRKRRELHRMTFTAIGSPENQQVGLTMDEQLRILCCYKPGVYAPHPLLVPPLNASPQKVAAMRQMHRNRERAQREKPTRVSHELAFLRGTHVESVLRVRPATNQ